MMEKVDMMGLLEDLWPMRRDLVSTGLSQALRRIAEELPLEIESFPTGSEAWTWIIPPNWEVDRAWIKADGRTIIDLADNPLHVMSYSQPVNRMVSRQELLAHLHTRPDQPTAVPFEFSYYRPDWGFCVEHNRLTEFQADEYDVLIDSHFDSGRLEIGTLHIPGSSSKEILLSAHLCHPFMANDDLSGVVVLVAVAQWLLNQQNLRYGYRILLGPETIGSLAFLSQHEDQISIFEAGLFLEMLGHDDSFSLQQSRQGESIMDKALRQALMAEGLSYREGAFRQVVRNDEGVINGPGVDVPCPSLSRAAFWSEGGLPFPEYHTSLDRPDIIIGQRLDEALEIVISVITMLEANYTPRRLFKGPVFLSRYDLWVDWRKNRELNAKSEEVMHLLEGDHDLLSIAQQLGLDFHYLKDWLDRFEENGLIEKLRA
jgi:aminopeptidase-like protein